MRSFSLKAALAAVLVSTSLAGAYAASPRTAPPLDQLQRDTLQARGVSATELDPMPTNAVTKAAPAAHAMMHQAHKAAYRPRLAHIVGRLDVANHRLRVDHDRGLLTRAEFRSFETRAHGIRGDALRIAQDHRGALPKARFVSLQTRVDRLDHAIRHAATT